LQAKGNTSGNSNYQYPDYNITALRSNNIYYRLEEVSKDGYSTLSKIVSIKLTNNTSVVVSPNPFNDKLKLTINSIINQSCYINITNVSGSSIATITQHIAEGVNTINYNTSNWSRGTCFIKVKFEDGTITTLEVVK
jgi:Secretion system C-terminal sorting domain